MLNQNCLFGQYCHSIDDANKLSQTARWLLDFEKSFILFIWYAWLGMLYAKLC